MTTCEIILEDIKKNLEVILSKRSDFRKKEDGSYVSKGDLLIQSIVINKLKEILPNYYLISEEKEKEFFKKKWDKLGSFVILDPIDGTENFVSGLKEWGVGISIYQSGQHIESCIFLPELNEYLITGMKIKKLKSRIIGLSSSLTKKDLSNLPYDESFEYRIIGCSMYNTLKAVKGSFKVFENVKGVNCWDILPGLNLALEHSCDVFVDEKPYKGQMLFPVKKYKIKISNVI